MNRRDWFQVSGLALGSSFALGQEKAAEPLAPLNRFPRTVQEWYVAQVRDAEKRSLAVQANLKTKKDAEIAADIYEHTDNRQSALRCLERVVQLDMRYGLLQYSQDAERMAALRTAAEVVAGGDGVHVFCLC